MNLTLRYNLLILITFFCFTACQHGQSCTKNDSNANDSIFKPVLKKEIQNFIEYVEKKHKGEIKYHDEPSTVYETYFYQENGICYFNIITNYYYNKELISGYTYIEDNLITYFGDDGNCNMRLIDENKLTPFNDTIKGYIDNTVFVDWKYDGLKRILRIINEDSISIIYTGLNTTIDIESLENE